MGKKEDLIRELEEFKQRLSKELQLNKMILFGSYSRGDYSKYSDADLIVVSPAFAREKSWKRPRHLYKHWRHKYPVDFLCYTPEEFEERKNQASLVRQALKEGVEI